MLDNWPKSGYGTDRSAAGCRFDRPAIGICFDIGRISSGKYGLTCWEILWQAVQPRLIAGSELFEGRILESDRVYCLAIQNNDTWRLHHVMATLELNADYLNVCAFPHFYEGDDVLREPLVAAGQVNETGAIIGISYNPRQALNKVRREKATVLANVPQSEILSCAGTGRGEKAGSAEAKQGPLKKWWQALRL